MFYPLSFPQAMAEPHVNRESTQKLLDALKAGKIKRVADLRQAEIDAALADVVAKVRPCCVGSKEQMDAMT